MTLSGARIHITGIVQGVGFRPFVYGLAARLGLKGWVRNTSAGVDIQVDGEEADLQLFAAALRNDLPPLARIDTLAYEACPAGGFTAFEIIHSEPVAGAFQPISPDVCICSDCLRELFDPGDRRYLYPFINCTNCGPRFTIITDIPYDRPNTSMAGFAMCPECRAEYEDPLDRRFHAQPVACPVCGPRVWLEGSDQLSVSNEQCSVFSVQCSDRLLPGEGEMQVDAPGMQSSNAKRQSLTAVLTAQTLIAQGQILAIKGLGGFHLACDATNPQAVQRLRERKLRVDKPFALMMPDIETVASHCHLNKGERQALESRQRPIVILRRKPDSNIAAEVAPCQDTLGVMLPYTPLHYLLFSNQLNQDASHGDEKYPPANTLSPYVFVMTSGNLSEEPIATDNQEARQRLGNLADAFLMHDRPIHTRCDDSVIRLEPAVAPRDNPSPTGDLPEAGILPLRRSRGYAPDPILLRWATPAILATGAELKNTFCLTRERYAFLSHHIGDLENYETLRSFEEGIVHFERLFRIRPEVIAYDLHPDYLSTRYALERAGRENLPVAGVQHHHAHIAACLGENEVDPGLPVIGVAFDGTGYGEDGAIWGGEFLLVHGGSYERVAHLAYTPLPGGDAAIRKPCRIALAHLWQAGFEWDAGLPSVEAVSSQERSVLYNQLVHELNTPLTSSMGRLFDAVASLAGLRQVVNYEAQAAIELEARVHSDETGAYEFGYRNEAGKILIDPAPVFKGIIQDWREKTDPGLIAARFHNGIARMVMEVCLQLRQSRGIDQVALSGGVWQNMTLFKKTLEGLGENRFKIYTHHRVPPNDGGIALGQALVAAWRSKCA